MSLPKIRLTRDAPQGSLAQQNCLACVCSRNFFEMEEVGVRRRRPLIAIMYSLHGADYCYLFFHLDSDFIAYKPRFLLWQSVNEAMLNYLFTYAPLFKREDGFSPRVSSRFLSRRPHQHFSSYCAISSFSWHLPS